MYAVTSFAEAVQFAARCVECPICKEACENPVRPKNCSHRYCMGCFRKCFQDKQEKHCATCRTPILSVSKRGFTEDALFSKVAALVPGIREAESDDDFDLAKMMERHRLQSAKIRQEAVQMRQGQPNKQPVAHATRQHPEAIVPHSSPPITQQAHAATDGAASAPPAQRPPGSLPPLDAAPRPSLPALASSGPTAGAGAASTAPAAAAPAAPPPPAAAAADSSGPPANGNKRPAGDMAAPGAGTAAGGDAGPDAKRAKS